MTLLIAHRGNIDGPNAAANSPTHLLHAMALGYAVEIDVHYHDQKWYLGHDEPEYLVPKEFLEHVAIGRYSQKYFHAKTPDTYLKLLDLRWSTTLSPFFWHESDTLAGINTTVLNNGITPLQVWTCDWTIQGSSVVHMIPTLSKWNDYKQKSARPIGGICSDYVSF